MGATQPTPAAGPLTPQEKADIKKWQSILILLGIGVVLLALGLQVWASTLHSTTTKDETIAKKTVTTTSGVGPPATLITTCLGGGVLLLIAGAFYSRITKISWNGLEVGLDSSQSADVQKKSADAGAKITEADPTKTADTVSKITQASTRLAITGNTLLARGYPASVIPSILGVPDMYPPGGTSPGDSPLTTQQQAEFINDVAVEAAVKQLGFSGSGSASTSRGDR